MLVCLLGIAPCARAGVEKERKLSTEEKTATIGEFNFVKGLWVAVFAALMSACMAFGFAAGKPIGASALELGTPSLWQNLPVLIVVLLGGFTTNLVRCLYLNVKKRTMRDHIGAGQSSLAQNYFFSALAGITWYLQFFFYGMGTTKMGRYDLSSWTIRVAFIIVFSNLWEILFREWRRVGRRSFARHCWTAS